MLFSSNVFLFFPLLIVCTLYLLVQEILMGYISLSASIFFYAWGKPRYVEMVLNDGIARLNAHPIAI